MDYKHPALSTSEALSGVFGTISLVAWIVLLLPQLWENYRAQSASAISLSFLFVWFIGDLTNLAGALWAGLVPTVIALAVYFCIADTLLIIQCLYYNDRERRLLAKYGPDALNPNSTAAANAESREDEPLLSRRTSIQSVASFELPYNRTRRRTLSASAPLPKVSEEDDGRPTTRVRNGARRFWRLHREAFKNMAAIIAVCVAGTAAWAIAYSAGIWKPVPAPRPDNPTFVTANDTPLGAEMLGYASALAYLGARIPQIFKNWRDCSCAGLSLLFFLLSLLGNLTYGAGILFHSLDRSYLVTNMPWLIGSLGTIGEDVVIFIQFNLYGDREELEGEDQQTGTADDDRESAVDER